MNKNIEHYVFHKENFLDEKYCENCIDELDKCDWEKHEWYDNILGTSQGLSGDNELEVMGLHMFSNDIHKINDLLHRGRESETKYVRSLYWEYKNTLGDIKAECVFANSPLPYSKKFNTKK